MLRSQIDDRNALPPAPKTTITAEHPGTIQYHDKRLMVLFFDFSNMGIPEQLRAQEAAQKFLDTQMTASDMVSIMTLTNELRVVQEFTNDRETLVTAIQSLRVGDSRTKGPFK